MSGHSKWSTIKRQKGVADIKRGQTFTKISNAIAIAARAGNLNFALEQAKIVNMPKESIQRAIDRGLGKLAGQTIDEVIFEGFGPGKVAFYLEGVTDNKLRTLQEIKNMFERSGGSLGGLGSASYMFDKKGEIKVRSKGGNIEDEMLELIDLGAEDVEDFKEEKSPADSSSGQKYLVYTQGPELNTMGNKITQAGFMVESQELVMKPNITVEIKDKETAEKVMAFAEKLEEHEDIQKVYANMDILEELM